MTTSGVVRLQLSGVPKRAVEESDKNVKEEELIGAMVIMN